MAIAGLNASFGSMGQIGGVYTRPTHRRGGVATSVMRALHLDACTRLSMDKLILFTGEHNVAARRLYESLGYSEFGHYSLLFGGWRLRVCGPAGSPWRA